MYCVSNGVGVVIQALTTKTAPICFLDNFFPSKNT